MLLTSLQTLLAYLGGLRPSGGEARTRKITGRPERFGPIARALILAFALVLLVLLAALALIGVVFRHHVFAGTALSLLRWPSLLLTSVTLLVVARALGPASKRLALALALVVVLLHGADLALELSHRARPEGPAVTGQPLSVLSYNVLYEGGRPELVIDTIRETDTDLVVLQEVTPAWAARLRQAFSERYPHARYDAREGTLGYAVLSRLPLGQARLLGPEKKPFAQVLLVYVGGRAVALANVHLYAPKSSINKGYGLLAALEHNAEERAWQWGEVAAHLSAEHPGRPHLVVGDLNTADHEPLHRQVARAYVDTFRAARATPGLTWPALPRGPLLRWPVVRIDHVLATPHFAVDEAWVTGGAGSDHLGVLARLRM